MSAPVLGRVTLAALVAALLACGGGDDTSPRSVPSQFTSPAYACSSLDAGPAGKLVLHPSGGVPDQFIVVLVRGQDVAATARALAARYDAQVLAIYDAVLDGFAVRMDPARAADIAAEPAVCWVEQDAVVRGDV